MATRPVLVYRKEVVNDGTTGNLMMALTDATGTFVVGETITDDTDGTITGVLTKVLGSGATQKLVFYETGAGSFSGATGAFTGGTSGATGTAVAPTQVGPVLVFPPAEDNLSLYAKVSGTGTVDNDIEMTVSDMDDVYNEVADWFPVVAGLTDLTNTTYNNTNAKSMGSQIVTAFRVLRNDADTVTLVALGSRREV